MSFAISSCFLNLLNRITTYISKDFALFSDDFG